VVNDPTSPLLFSTENVASGNGTDEGASALIGPGLAGLIVITPSIPVSRPEGVCPEQSAAHMTRNIETVGTPANFTTKFSGMSLVAQQKRVRRARVLGSARAPLTVIGVLPDPRMLQPERLLHARARALPKNALDEIVSAPALTI
jgi:hypothetical protein